MELKELVDGFAANLGIEGLALNSEGFAALVADDMTIRITEHEDGRRFLLEGEIGEPPPEGQDRLDRAILKMNSSIMSSQGFSVAIDSEDKYVLVALSDYENKSLEQFAEKIESFLNELERLRGLLSEYTPLAGDLSKAEGASIAEYEHAIMDGFLQA